MSQYVQLLGTDTPNSFGGCCYYGAIDHAALQPAPMSSAAAASSLSSAEGGADSPVGLAWREVYTKILAASSSSSSAPSAPCLSEVPPAAFPSGASGSEGYLLFNCPEGTQRFSSEANIKLTKVKGFFFTRWARHVDDAVTEPASAAEEVAATHRSSSSSSDAMCEGSASAVMGLPGLLFTINDAGVRHATFFGPSTALRAHTYLDNLSHATDRDLGERDDQTHSPLPEGWQSALARKRLQPAYYMRLHGPAGSLAASAGEGSEREQASLVSSRQGCSSGGLERFLYVLRASYFFYRSMTFRQLVPIDVHRTGLKALLQRPGGGRAGASRLPPCTDTPCAFLPQDEVYPILTAAPTQPTNPDGCQGKSTGLSESGAFRLVMVLPLSAHSVLLAFRTSTSPSSPSLIARREGTSGTSESVGAEDSSGDVFGYALVSAPPAAFDAAKAKALGVKPGPKYALLKQGIAVFTDDDNVKGKGGTRDEKRRGKTGSGEGSDRGVDGGEGDVHDQTESKRHRTEGPVASSLSGAGHSSGRLVQPHEVSQATVSSTQLFLTLILDSNSADDTRAALKGLLLSRGDAGGTANGGMAPSALEQALQALPGDLLWYREHPPKTDTSVGGGGVREVLRRRAVVVRQVVHVQPDVFFSRFSATHDSRSHGTHDNDDVGAVYSRYLHYVFEPIIASGAVSLSVTPTLRFSSSATEEEEDKGTECNAAQCTPPAPGITTLHLFTSQVQRDFTAFPTALVHRYHLNAIAPRCFPVGERASQQDDQRPPRPDAEPALLPLSPPLPPSGRRDEYWPYSLKFKCVSDAGDAPAHSNRKKNVNRSASTTATTAPAAALLPSELRERVVSEGASAPYIRYPTRRTALSMLSSSFLQRLAGTRDLSPSLHTFPERSVTSHAEGEATCDGGGALVFTGTGSAVPSKYRNVSGTVLEVRAPGFCFGRGDSRAGEVRRCGSSEVLPGDSSPARGVFVLDFGEGSAGQLRELLTFNHDHRADHGDGDGRVTSWWEVPPALASLVLDIELVFISHGHADHHLGLLSLLSLRHSCLTRERCGCHAPNHLSSAGARRRLDSKLLVVLPAEVFYFLHYSWFTAQPYAEWVYEECEFDILPPASAGRPHDSHDGGAGYAPRDSDDATEQGDEVNPQQRVAFDLGKAWQTNTSPLSLGFPRLKALCKQWNASIQAALGGQPAVYWDADIFTVDHPANAHAILLRFPYYQRAGGETGVAAAGHPRDRDVSPSVSATPTAQPPCTSKVFLFSGDTRPSDALVERCNSFCRTGRRCRDASPRSGEGKTADHDGATGEGDGGVAGGGEGGEGLFICLHEATFGPGYEADAVKKKHSTLPEALDIGRRTRAAFIVLNHFSQRYPKLPGLTEEHLDGSPVDLECKPSSRRRLKALGGGSGDVGDARETSPGEGGEAEDAEHSPDVPAHPEEACVAPEPSGGHGPSQSVCFAFDLMRLPFDSVRDGSVARLLPTFVRLLEEYESWGVGTTQRLRE